MDATTGLRTTRGRSIAFFAVWHSLSLGLLLSFAALRTGAPLWLPSDTLRLGLILLGTGYAVSVVVAIRFTEGRLTRTTLTTTAVFGLVFLGLLLMATPVSRMIVAVVYLTALASIPLSFFARDRVAPVTVLLVFVLAITAITSLSRLRDGAIRVDRATIVTARHPIRLTRYRGAVPRPPVLGGAITSLDDDRFLLVTGDGLFYLLSWGEHSDSLEVQPLPHRAPINGDEFAAAAGLPWRDPRARDPMDRREGEDGSDKVIPWWFRVNDVLTRHDADSIQVLVSHYYWNTAAECWTVRVSAMGGDQAQVLAGTSAPEWSTVYESSPCLPIRGPDRRRQTPFAGLFGGGRMAWLDSVSVLLTIGDFGFDGTSSTQQFAQDPRAAYGKTVRIRPEERTAQVFTSGHRNPEGLYIQREDGVIWLTEHGPQGGDELNRLEAGANYGWPYSTYGTQYGTFTWPLERSADSVEASVPPTFAWLPSIGVSSLIRVEQGLFSSWQGDLLIGSLVAKTLYRLKVLDQRIVFAEPIPISERIRDVAEGTSGRIVLWTDEGTIILLGLATEKNGETVFATLCRGCHLLGDGTNHRIGPDLDGVTGRAVASATGYAYSPAMKAKGGRWTPDRLKAFLLHPQSEIPSTTMEFPGLPDSSAVSALIEYLRQH